MNRRTTEREALRFEDDIDGQHCYGRSMNICSAVHLRGFDLFSTPQSFAHQRLYWGCREDPTHRKSVAVEAGDVRREKAGSA